MMSGKTGISDMALHAYVDGELDSQQRLAVEAWLASHPQDAERVREYRLLQQRFHARFDPVLNENPGNPALLKAQRPAPRLGRAAVMATLMLASGLLGWMLRGGIPASPLSPALTKLVQPATFAHQVYSTDARYPVEIPASAQSRLNQWVSLRMHRDLQAPDLSAIDLKLLGGRLLPSTDRMAAQFMYEDHQGQRLTVYVRRLTEGKNNTDFQYQERGGLHVFYWVDDAMGYAVVGTQAASQLVAIANAVQSGFARTKRTSRQ